MSEDGPTLHPLANALLLHPERVVLPLERFMVTKRIPQTVLSNMKFDCQLEDSLRDLVMYLSKEIVRSAPRTETVQFDVPATWWQHLKQDHAPEWFLKRYPVVMRQIPFSYEGGYRTCPHADKQWGHDSHLRFLMFRDEWRPAAMDGNDD